MTYGIVAVLSGDVRSGKLTAWLKYFHAIDARFTNVYLVDNSGSDDFFQELVVESLAFGVRFNKLTIVRYHKLLDAGVRASAMVTEDHAIVVDDSQAVYADLVHKVHQTGSHVWNLPIEQEPVEWTRPISSFCTVATYNMVSEFMIMVKSVRLHHEDTPIVVFCDKLLEEYITTYGNESWKLDVHITMSPESLKETVEREGFNAPKQSRWKSVIDPNPHRPEIIHEKMAVMQYAIDKHGDTMFLDADIILAAQVFAPIKGIDEASSSPLALSPHFNTDDKSLTIGRYNAGMVWSDNASFPGWWRHGFLNDSMFFEQECLNRASGTWRVAEYPECHNYGFWRLFSLGKQARMIDIPELCRALKLEATPAGPTVRGDVIKSWHVHPFSNRDGDEALAQLMKYLLRNSGDAVSTMILNLLK